MPTLGDTKPCILGDGGETGCDGTMEWKTVRPPDAMFTKDGAEVPEPIPDYQAWVCGVCGMEQRQ
jgi:hypothetical protein